MKSIINIDDFELGYWKIENHFKRAKFIRQKCYIEEIEENGKVDLKITCAGMPKQCYSDVTFENFGIGFTSENKLVPKNVEGGVILKNTTFEIKSF